jgi:hypothetical protein
MRLDEVRRMPTSEEWRVVRQFVRDFRTKAHETVVDKTVAQKILAVQDALGIELLTEMLTHEKRMAELNVTQRFWMEKDAQDEADYERSE